jgi:3-dehydroquinate synthase
MSTIPVETPSASYVIECGRGVLSRAGSLVDALGPSSGVHLISSPTVWKHLGRSVARGFGRKAAALPILFRDSEQSKNMRTVESLCRSLVRAGADRRAVLVAVGGGVVGDVAGYAAASYLRGVRVVHIPTTLVALVDSSIGGKTGVNLPEGKNLVGAFYQPALVIADPEVLRTLPSRQFRSGLYEVIKYGVLGDRSLFEYLENRLELILERDRASLDWILPRCIASKASIVGRDERESGPREILNLGHTFGHALEALTRYRRFAHGEAVAWGMIAAARLAVVHGCLERREAQRIERLVFATGPLPSVPRIPVDRWLAAMRSDKKARAGRLRFILPCAIGKVSAVDGIAEKLVGRVVSSLAGGGKKKT